MLTLIDNVPFNAFAWLKSVWTQDAEVVSIRWFSFAVGLPIPRRCRPSCIFPQTIGTSSISTVFFGFRAAAGEALTSIFDTYDLSSQRFQQGHHILSAVVWHDLGYPS